MLSLYLQAPFAVCRTFTAGWYRPTAGFLTPSAAYGLILNVAGIESRLREEEAGHHGKTPATLMRADLPRFRIALGVPASGGNCDEFPAVQSLYQQLHNYPVGKDAGMPAELAKGNKNNITPVRREILCGLRALVFLDGNDEVDDRVRRGLRGDLNEGRYGLPFLGDNQFLLDKLEECGEVPPARWYERLEGDEAAGPRSHTTRLTIWIDRADMSKTTSALYAPTQTATSTPPAAAWTDVGPPADVGVTSK
ncbi:MAG TPA: type I-MYXAN CRISPR-associated protein Cas5/Cmx5/DevS [Pirellulales bacterium]|nr:type I-MYXAN CRISPR-associated protein Cas5/Cmx5/DevS [Pirellulales bacterium]